MFFFSQRAVVCNILSRDKALLLHAYAKLLSNGTCIVQKKFRRADFLLSILIAL